MVRFASPLAALALLTCIGCGSSSQTAENRAASGPDANHPSPTDVVSQFLDEVRRGGEDSRANDLLTERARAELTRIGQSIQPIGSPDAGFVVTRAESVPGETNTALVHSVWTEPSADGTSGDFQVVWAVELEPVGWRISGLAMELDPNADPVIIDFENAEMMANLLASPDEPTGAASQAAAPGQAVSR